MQEVENETVKSKARSRLLAQADKAEKFAARRNPNAGTTSRVVISCNVKQRRRPVEYRQNIQYDFLQYIRIVYKWATANHNVTRGELELMLYLNPIGLFGKNDFAFFYRTVSLYQKKGLQNMIDKGWIVQWRENKKRERALYTLSTKGKTLCSRVHKMCVGEEPIPESNNNALVTDKKTAINKFYMDVVKNMNKKLNEKSPAS